MWARGSCCQLRQCLPCPPIIWGLQRPLLCWPPADRMMGTGVRGVRHTRGRVEMRSTDQQAWHGRDGGSVSKGSPPHQRWWEGEWAKSGLTSWPWSSRVGGFSTTTVWLGFAGAGCLEGCPLPPPLPPPPPPPPPGLASDGGVALAWVTV